MNNLTIKQGLRMTKRTSPTSETLTPRRWSGFFKRLGVGLSFKHASNDEITTIKTVEPQGPGLARSSSAFWLHVVDVQTREHAHDETKETLMRLLACPMGSLYLAWFLLARHPSYFRLLMLHGYVLVYRQLNAAGRRMLAQRIMETFLTRGFATSLCLNASGNVPSGMALSENGRGVKVGHVLQRLAAHAVEAGPGLFDELDKLCVVLMLDILSGKENADCWEELPSREFSFRGVWSKSPFSQAWLREQPGVPSVEHLHCVIQRILGMPLWLEEDVLQKDVFVAWLDLLGVEISLDCKRSPAWMEYQRAEANDSFFESPWNRMPMSRPRSSASRMSVVSRTSSQSGKLDSPKRKDDDSPTTAVQEVVAPTPVTPSAFPTSSHASGAFVTIEEEPALEIDTQPVEPSLNLADTPLASPRRRPRRSTASSSPMLAAYMMNQGEGHIFVQGIGSDEWCEYCLEPVDAQEKHGLEPFVCQTCNYVCHRSCRSHVAVMCMRVENVDLTLQDGAAEIQQRLQNLRVALEREASMSLALSRIVSARKQFRRMTPNSNNDSELDAQMKESERKIASLRAEVRRHQVMLATSQTTDAELVQISHEPQDGHRISKSLFYDKQTMTAKEVIASAVQKFGLSGSPEDYQLTNGADGKEVVFDATNVALDLRVDLAGDVRLVSKADPQLSPKTESLAQASKLREALCEVIDTEQGFVARLDLIQTVYLDPLVKLDANVDVLAGSLKPVRHLHFVILQRLLAMDVRAAPLTSLEMLVVLVSNTFAQKIDQLELYVQCLVDMSRLETELDRLAANNAEFDAAKKRCDADSRLGRYRLADLIIMPLHRLTRIPLLLKRIVNYLEPSSVVSRLEGTIVKFEAKVTEVNAQVHELRCNLRTAELASNLDFGSTPPFVLDKHRRLIGELACKYKRRGEDVVEVSLCLFDDVILIVKAKGDGRFKVVKPPIPLESLILVKHAANQMVVEFELLHASVESQKHKLQATSREVGEWLTEANNARKQLALKITKHLLYE